MKLSMMIKRINRSQQGFGLVETMVAVAILGTAVVVFVAALSTGAIGTSEHDLEATAQRLAQEQLEYVKSYTYVTGALTYPAISGPEGYTVFATASNIPGTDPDIQMITVTIYRKGENILEISDYKVNR